MNDHDDSISHPSRRAVLSAAAAGAAVGVTGSARALDAGPPGCLVGPPPHPKGPLVFMDYDQIELVDAYDERS